MQWKELRNDKNSSILLKPTQPNLELFINQCYNATPENRKYACSLNKNLVDFHASARSHLIHCNVYKKFLKL